MLGLPKFSLNSTVDKSPVDSHRGERKEREKKSKGTLYKHSLENIYSGRKDVFRDRRNFSASKKVLHLGN